MTRWLSSVRPQPRNLVHECDSCQTHPLAIQSWSVTMRGRNLHQVPRRNTPYNWLYSTKLTFLATERKTRPLTYDFHDSPWWDNHAAIL